MTRRLLPFFLTYLAGLGALPPWSPGGEALPMPPVAPSIPLPLLLMRASFLASLAAFFSALAAARSSGVMLVPAVGSGLALFWPLVVPGGVIVSVLMPLPEPVVPAASGLVVAPAPLEGLPIPLGALVEPAAPEEPAGPVCAWAEAPNNKAAVMAARGIAFIEYFLNMFIWVPLLALLGPVKKTPATVKGQR